jgi:hypothetical protein
MQVIKNKYKFNHYKLTDYNKDVEAFTTFKSFDYHLVHFSATPKGNSAKPCDSGA